ncbi:pantoate--beta-alanine ligase [Pelagibacterium lacus]|uniref:Pantothenate synthetase n=1 Tax=Pelagibacterium lacus TaxID=2282655 RepID=A0A369W6R1_9HYPH|nr:pantoate--beta-alanine ligase [Pelagibacterium lacus]RDE09727.1 pantoate--beta-alanine ligase [Pelagibacterium lacus]
MGLPIVRSVAELRAQVRLWRGAGDRIGLVPTMGALHEGHLSLVRAARGRADRVIVTLFVNPRQFNSAEDLRLYPRSEAEDAARLETEGVDLLFAPGVEAMYPEGFSTTVSVKGVSEGLCGAHRPGHFDGVATVVAKLFLQSQADIAVFGEKDYQQLAVIRRMAQDLDIPIEIIGASTVRAADGLALSSRNARLSPEGRSRAVALITALTAAADQLTGGAEAEPILAAARRSILEGGFGEVEYLELRDAADLAPVQRVDRSAARLLVAAWIDGVRLIDNVPVWPGPEA